MSSHSEALNLVAVTLGGVGTIPLDVNNRWMLRWQDGAVPGPCRGVERSFLQDPRGNQGDSSRALTQINRRGIRNKAPWVFMCCQGAYRWMLGLQVDAGVVEGLKQQVAILQQQCEQEGRGLHNNNQTLTGVLNELKQAPTLCVAQTRLGRLVRSGQRLPKTTLSRSEPSRHLKPRRRSLRWLKGAGVSFEVPDLRQRPAGSTGLSSDLRTLQGSASNSRRLHQRSAASQGAVHIFLLSSCL
ncbi:unnamed protein product [Pleuronectes platessa]|uniref:Uncharacterized protein n=1 Tax=Pleuronectes platessa TaxID=8262 RepID=A0A9N7UQ81_PLEPL|nr:unnamed protein product [Pleuronectes platessa]